MKRYLALLCPFVMITFSCGPGDQKDSGGHADNRTEPGMKTGLASGSYEYCFVTADDTAILSVRVSEDGVDGSLLLQYFGKDRNDGKLENAYFRKDTLFADYRFWSEGGQSLREVMFLVNDDVAREGYGPVKVTGDKQVFVSHKGVAFNGPAMSADGCGLRVPTFIKPENKE
jgi:hypothetical protein